MKRPVIIERTADNAAGLQMMAFNVSQKMVYLANDSDTYDMTANFDKTTDEAGSFTVKAGEIVNDVPMEVISISIKGIGGSVAFRVMGV